jgi:hypothetical protein
MFYGGAINGFRSVQMGQGQGWRGEENWISAL